MLTPHPLYETSGGCGDVPYHKKTARVIDLKKVLSNCLCYSYADLNKNESNINDKN